MSNLEPVWTLQIQQWWEALLGPGLSQAWAAVKGTGSAPALLTKAHGAAVRSFAAELRELGKEAHAFAVEAEGTVWAPFAEKTLEVHRRIVDRWQDPQATKRGGAVEGLLDPVASVMRVGNTAVSAIGMAWALASLAHVLHARRTLKRWREHLAADIDPSRRDTRRAGIEGVAVDDVGDVLGDLVGFRPGFRPGMGRGRFGMGRGGMGQGGMGRFRMRGRLAMNQRSAGGGPSVLAQPSAVDDQLPPPPPMLATPPPPPMVPVSGVEIGCEGEICDCELAPGFAYRGNDAIPTHALVASLAYPDGAASLDG